MGDLSSQLTEESAWLKQVASTSFEEIAVDLPAGAHLRNGRYEVQHELGRGGMGVVYAAWDNERRESVALKTLTRSSPTSIYRIKREFRGLGHVVHHNLVRLHELFEDGGRWCFTLELVPGETLLRALRGSGLSTLRPLLRQLAEGISALHAAGKLHRDLKPSNVMLTPDRRVVILDFGLAEDIDVATRKDSITSGPSGTPGYIAPELREGGAATQASDWYSFGVILWQLLTRLQPFEENRWPPRAVESSWLPQANHRLPADLVQLCRALLSPEPAARPGALEVSRALGPEPAAAGGVQSSLAPHGTPIAGALYGRAQELGELHQAYEASCRGPLPVVVLLAGDSGIGKTALVLSFVRELEGAAVLVGRCYEREFVPYKAFDAIVDELCRHLAQLPASELERVLPADFPALCRLFPVLGRVHEPNAPAADGEDAHELRRRGFEALGQLLGRLRERGPVVLWIDDLHWTDTDSTRLLLHLLRQADAPRILLIASHRSDPAEAHPCLQPMYQALSNDVRLDVRTLELGPLAHEHATALLESVSPGAPPALAERAGGHPFLLEELSRYAARRAHGCAVWPSLEEALGSRIDALGKDERRVLELLALAGHPLPDPVAWAAAGTGWHASLQALSGSRLVRRSAVDGSLSCYHDVIREAVVGAMSTRRARECHRALARGMLSTSDPRPERLALHLAGCGHTQRAAEQMVIAARRAADTLAFERAAQLYQSALGLGRFEPSEARRLRLARADALSAAGRGNEAAELYLRAVEPGDTEDGLELRMRAAEQYLLSGRLEQGLELLRSALRPFGVRLHATAFGAITSFVYHRVRLRLRGYHFEARPVSEATARHLLLLNRATAALLRLDPLRASELASRAMVLALEAGSAEAISNSLVGDLVMGALFQVSEAELGRRITRAREACTRFGRAAEWAHYHSGVAAAARFKALPDLPEALVHLERFFEIHEQHALPRASYERPWEEWARAMVRCWQGELARVAHEVPARLDEGWARGDHCIVPLWAGGNTLLARLAVGDVVAAERDLERARRVWSSRSFTLQDLMLTLGAFHLELHRGDLHAAWQIAEAARARLEKSPLRRMPNAVDTLQALRGHAALELAAQARSTSERRELLRWARRIHRAPRRRPNLAAMFRGHLLAAAYHYQSGDHERAALVLARAEPHLTSLPLYAHAVRYRRGLLVGGQEGAACVADAKQFLAAGGAVDPDNLVELLLPGYTPRRS